MKKVLSVSLAFVFCLLLCSCGGSPAPLESATSTPKKTEAVAKTTSPAQTSTPSPEVEYGLPDITWSGAFATNEDKTLDDNGNVIGTGTSWYVWNENIPESVEKEISVLDDIIVNSIIDIDPFTFTEHLDDMAKSSDEKILELLTSFNNTLSSRSRLQYLKGYAQVFYEDVFYSSLFNPDMDLVINYGGYKVEMYISLINFSNETTDTLLCLIYGRQNGDWELYNIYLNDESYHGMNAVDMYNKSKKMYDDGYLVPAVLYYVPIQRIINPAKYINYNNEKEITSYFDALLQELYEQFPLPMQLPSDDNITLYNINLEVVSTGFMPIIGYTSQIEPIDANENALNDEAHAIHNELIKLFPGFSESFDHFLYRAYTEPPIDPQKAYSGYASLVDETQDN